MATYTCAGCPSRQGNERHLHEGHCASSLGNAPPFLQTFVLLLLGLILGIFFPVILLLFVSVFLT